MIYVRNETLNTITLVSLIEVQDILINFQPFSSQEALIKDRMIIKLLKISEHEIDSFLKIS